MLFGEEPPGDGGADEDFGFDPLDGDPLGLDDVDPTAPREADSDGSRGDSGAGDDGTRTGDGDRASGEADGSGDGTEDGDGTGARADGSGEDGTDGDGATIEGAAEDADPLARSLGEAELAALREAAPGAEARTVGELVRDLGDFRRANAEMVEVQNLLDGVFGLDAGLAAAISEAVELQKAGETVNVAALLAEKIPALDVADLDAFDDPAAAKAAGESAGYLKARKEQQARAERERQRYVEDWQARADEEFAAFAEEVGEEAATEAALTLRRFTQGDETGGVFRMPAASEMLGLIHKGRTFDAAVAAAREEGRTAGLEEGRTQRENEKRRRGTGSPRLSPGGAGAREAPPDPLGLGGGPRRATMHEQF